MNSHPVVRNVKKVGILMATQTIYRPGRPQVISRSEDTQIEWSQGIAPTGTLILEDGTTFEGRSFGYTEGRAGEVVFSTGMVGYPEALTDASFAGQILVMTYPLLGNYGVPTHTLWEADRIHVSGLIVSNYIDTPVHAQSTTTLASWLKQQKVTALEIKDTRLLTQHIRRHGAMLGKIVLDNDIPFYDPNQDNLIAQVSTPHVIYEGKRDKQHGKKTLALIDCGTKRNIQRCLLQRGLEVITVPWDYDL